MSKMLFTLDSPVWNRGKFKESPKTIRDMLLNGEHSYVEWIRDKVDSVQLDPQILHYLDSGQIPGRIPGSVIQGIPAPPPVPANNEPTQYSLDNLKEVREAMDAIRQCIVPHPVLGSVVVLAPAENLNGPLGRVISMLQEMEVCFKAGKSCTFTALPVDTTKGAMPSPSPQNTSFPGDPFGNGGDDLPF